MANEVRRDYQEELEGLLAALRAITGDPEITFESPEYEARLRELEESASEKDLRLAEELRKLEERYREVKREARKGYGQVLGELFARRKAFSFLQRVFGVRDPKDHSKVYPHRLRIAIALSLLVLGPALYWAYLPEIQARREAARAAREARIERLREQAQAQAQAPEKPAAPQEAPAAAAGGEAGGEQAPPEGGMLPPPLPEEGAGPEAPAVQPAPGAAEAMAEPAPPPQPEAAPAYYTPPPGYEGGPAEVPPGAEGEPMLPRRMLARDANLGKVTAQARVNVPRSGEKEGALNYRGSAAVIRSQGQTAAQGDAERKAVSRLLVGGGRLTAATLVSPPGNAGNEANPPTRRGGVLIRPASYRGGAEVVASAAPSKETRAAVLVRDGKPAPARKEGTRPELRGGLAGLAQASGLPTRGLRVEGTGPAGGGEPAPVPGPLGALDGGAMAPKPRGRAAGKGFAPPTAAPRTERASLGAVPWKPGEVVPARLEVGVVMHEGMTEAPVVAKSEDGTVFFGRATLRADKRMAITFHSAFKDGVGYEVYALARDPRGDFGLPATVEEIAPALFTDLMRGALTGVTRYIDAYTESVKSTVAGDGTVVQERPVPPLDITVLSGVANLFKVPDDQRALIRVFRLPKGTKLDILFLPPQQAMEGRDAGGPFEAP